MYFTNLSPDSRVWVYQANRAFTASDKLQLEEDFKVFVASWAAHGSQLVADAVVINDYFVVLAVDEKTAMASGCSIDSSVKFIKSIGQQLNIDFFNRLKLLVANENETKMISFSDLDQYKGYSIYNTFVNTVNQLNNSFIIPVEQSELFKMKVL